jgi:cation:H+ antiporter
MFGKARAILRLMVIPVIQVLGGLLLLSSGAECLVRGSAALALRFGISPLVVGLTVVAFGTSSPEIVVSLQSALKGNSALALGNVIGSNISNVALILGLSVLVRPLRVQSQVIRREIPLMIFASLLLCLLLLGGQLNRLEGLLLVLGSIGYTALAYISARKNRDKNVEEEYEEALPRPKGLAWVNVASILVGLSLLIVGANLLVAGAITIAEGFGVSQVVIGLTIVAVGTSLPELATSIAAASKDEGDIVIGNVIGSNVLNILFVLGVAALVAPIHTNDLRLIDLAVMAGSAAIIFPLMRRGFQLTRWEGAFLLAGYIGYLYSLMP